MLENRTLEDWESLYEAERFRIPVRELSPDVTRNFAWEGWDREHKIPAQCCQISFSRPQPRQFLRTDHLQRCFVLLAAVNGAHMGRALVGVGVEVHPYFHTCHIILSISRRAYGALSNNHLHPETAMENIGWSDEERKRAWAEEGARPSNYRRTEDAIGYLGPVPQICACGEYHAPRESCPIFGNAFTPRGQ